MRCDAIRSNDNGAPQKVRARLSAKAKRRGASPVLVADPRPLVRFGNGLGVSWDPAGEQGDALIEAVLENLANYSL